MSIQAVGMKAYTNALSNFTKADKAMRGTDVTAAAKTESPFESTLRSSLGKVNELQKEKSAMIESFASGETQNVHELMISMQKASVAMNMTAAVRNKVMEAYKELARIQF